jgi:hypothetical protein
MTIVAFSAFIVPGYTPSATTLDIHNKQAM